MRITKVAYDGERVVIQYQKRGKKQVDWDKFVIDSSEQPNASFTRLLQSLREYVAKICDYPEDEAEKVKVLGVHVSWKGEKEDIMGVVVTAIKRVKMTTSPLLLNTPFLPEKSLTNKKSDAVLQKDVVEKINLLCDAAEAYVDGERGQLKLAETQRN